MFGLLTGTIPQWGAFGSLLGIFAFVVVVWVKGIPDRHRVKIQEASVHAKIEEDLRGEAALRFQEFRKEVHDLRGELQVMMTRVTKSEATSERRAGDLNMMAFILRLVMGELRRLDPDSSILVQAEALLSQVIIHDPGENRKTRNSRALKTAEQAIEIAHDLIEEADETEKGAK